MMTHSLERSETAEGKRLEEARLRKVHWKRWGPYLSERQWGTVREDYSPNGTAWDYLTHDHARSRAYRWGEDGIAGISDRHQYTCFALALWNGRDPILKERLFGLTGTEGNHGEDVKEYYFYLDATPTHSYMKFLYKYPQSVYPYSDLVRENASRSRTDSEFELLDTGLFDGDRYFDVFVEYAKISADDILVKISAHNRGPEAAELHLLPTVWFRNTWSWGVDQFQCRLSGRDDPKAAAARKESDYPSRVISIDHSYYGRRWLICEGSPSLLFTENETNSERLEGRANSTPYVKDGIGEFVVKGIESAVNPEETGTKAAAHYRLSIPPGDTAVIRLRLTDTAEGEMIPADEFEKILTLRKTEADEFYSKLVPTGLSEDGQNIQRQAFAGLLWTKQFYHYDVKTWLEGDPGSAPSSDQRVKGRNSGWTHLYNADIISMPDKWEYPWYASWDLAFHCLPHALVDPDFAKEQIVLLLREWYMHPNGQIPAYEWEFGDVNPPVHAWAAWRIYKIESRLHGRADREFLEKVFHKLLLNFTWWVNRKDPQGNNVFQGGFLGLDNIGVFDRSSPLPTGGFIEQSDGTSWMGMYCLNMLAIALELAKENRAYADVASKFFEHFVYIAHAMNKMGHEGLELWDEEDGFYYDVLHMPDGKHRQMKVRSMVGLIPLFAVEILEPETVDALPGFKNRMQWFIENRPHLKRNLCSMEGPDGKVRRLLSIAGKDRLMRILRYLLDEDEFLSPYGIRALSKYHEEHPYVLHVDGGEHRVDYQPGESESHMFGGNSNWRGPIWFPVNFLLIESLQRFQHYFGNDMKVECPTGSGNHIPLVDVAKELSLRLNNIFTKDASGRRPVYGELEKFQKDPHWRDLIQFHEYFHGDTGLGLGASHQTGWTGLVAKLIEQSGCR